MIELQLPKLPSPESKVRRDRFLVDMIADAHRTDQQDRAEVEAYPAQQLEQLLDIGCIVGRRRNPPG